MKRFFVAKMLLILSISLVEAACNPWLQNCSQEELYSKTCWGFDGKTCLCCNAHRYIWVSGDTVCKRGYVWSGKIYECLNY